MIEFEFDKICNSYKTPALPLVDGAKFDFGVAEKRSLKEYKSIDEINFIINN